MQLIFVSSIYVSLILFYFMRATPRFLALVHRQPVGADEVISPGAWALALSQADFRRRALCLVGLLFIVAGLLVPPFFAYIQQRPGVQLADPLLALLPRRDVATLIFLLMYGALGAALGWLARQPQLLLRGLWAYLLLTVLRLAAIWLVPLVPPAGLLPMPDPFVTLLFHSAHSELITNDLFFSGHTATVTLLALAVRGRWWQAVLGLMATLVGLLVLVQRVHYSYDVLAAPFFAWLAYRASVWIVPEQQECPVQA